MGGGGFLLLKAGDSRPESSKQAEIQLANLLKILRIPPVLEAEGLAGVGVVAVSVSVADGVIADVKAVTKGHQNNAAEEDQRADESRDGEPDCVAGEEEFGHWGGSAETEHRLLDDVLAFFGGGPKRVMAHLIDTGQLTLEDVEEAEQRLRALRRRKGNTR